MPHGFVELFEHPIEGQAHAVCRVASTLCQAYVQFVACAVGQVDCLAFFVGGIVLAKSVCSSSAVVMLSSRTGCHFCAAIEASIGHVVAVLFCGVGGVLLGQT